MKSVTFYMAEDAAGGVSGSNVLMLIDDKERKLRQTHASTANQNSSDSK